MLLRIISVVLGIAAVACASPAIPSCSTFLWNTVGKHDPPPCTQSDENQVLHQLENIKKYYSTLFLHLPQDDLFSYPHIQDIISDIKSLMQQEEQDTRSNVVCTACKTVIELVRYYIEEGKSNDELYGLIEQLCTSFKIQSPSVCAGISQLFGPEIIFIINTTSVQPLDICTYLIDGCGEINETRWEIELSPPQPLQTQPPPPSDAPVLKVLHIADTHYDRFYTEGARVYCNEPLCCRLENGMAEGDERAAGKWGDWRCDTPERTLDSMLEHAANTHPDIDYIVWTGDLPSHDVWLQTPQDSLEVLNISVSKIKNAFPNIPVFPAVGNHESSPVDSFPAPTINWDISWLYNALSEEWSTWLPEDTASTIKKGAYYTALARSGLRIVSLNTNYCYNANWWLVLNSTDPAQQLQWLVEVLKNAEEKNEKVHILAHIPPGQNDCMDVWKDNYYKIITRFENTVAGQFFGHTHKDEFEIYYDVNNDTRPVGVGYIGPAVTTYTSLNPGYRVYYVDGDREDTTRMVVDHENWVLDLEQSNLSEEAKWYLSYSARQEYGLQNLTPEVWQKFYENLKEDDELFQKYYQHYYKDSPERGTCDQGCKRGRLCAIRSCRRYGEPGF